MGREYGLALITVAAATAVAWLAFPYLHLSNLIMVYLLGVLVLAARARRGPALAASILSVAAFDFFFVPPLMTFAVSDPQHLVTFAVMLAVALTISGLATRLRAQAEAARDRERHTAALYAMSRDLASTRGVPDLLATAARHVCDVFASEVAVLLPAPDGRLLLQRGLPGAFEPDGDDLAAAHQAFEQRQPAGLGTKTLPRARALSLPLVALRGALGALVVRPHAPRALRAPEKLRQLETFANHTSLALERARLADEAQAAHMHVETERLRSSLLSSVSHDLRTPLATITGVASTLLDPTTRLDETTRRELLESVRDEADALNRLVQNLLEMTRVESGALELRRDWHPVEEVVGAALRRLRRGLAGRRVDVSIPPDLPMALMDDVLVEQVLINLVDNALKYTPAGSPIHIVATAGEGRLTVEVADRGPGLRPGEEERSFEKFHRGSTAERGAGLGLAICKGVVQAHGGRIWAHNLPGGGVAFLFTLPVTGAPPAVVPADG